MREKGREGREREKPGEKALEPRRRRRQVNNCPLMKVAPQGVGLFYDFMELRCDSVQRTTACLVGHTVALIIIIIN